jgi:type I site-specific restriction-modification system R (restriction) subunit
MSIEKQLLINSLNAPVELLDIVKSYCFYDRKTFEMIQYAKLQKEKAINSKAGQIILNNPQISI